MRNEVAEDELLILRLDIDASPSKDGDLTNLGMLQPMPGHECAVFGATNPGKNAQCSLDFHASLRRADSAGEHIETIASYANHGQGAHHYVTFHVYVKNLPQSETERKKVHRELFSWILMELSYCCQQECT